jgi:predicted enzyme related to lactoylglutathione lyase
VSTWIDLERRGRVRTARAGSAVAMNPGGFAGRRAMGSVRAQRVVHLELHTGDLAGACDLYGRLCGWRPERVESPAGAYVALELGGVGGGVVECPTARALWLPYVEVPEIGAATARAAALGAAVLLAPREGPAGWRSVVRSPVGGELAFWQPKR